jgi:hypothetical protein
MVSNRPPAAMCERTSVPRWNFNPHEFQIRAKGVTFLTPKSPALAKGEWEHEVWRVVRRDDPIR